MYYLVTQGDSILLMSSRDRVEDIFDINDFIKAKEAMIKHNMALRQK